MAWEIVVINHLFLFLQYTVMLIEYFHYFLIEFYIIVLCLNSVNVFHKLLINMYHNTKRYDRCKHPIFYKKNIKIKMKKKIFFFLQIFVFAWSWYANSSSWFDTVDVDIKCWKCIGIFWIWNWILITTIKWKIIFKKMWCWYRF
jgi:hypothetical protein